MRTLLGIGVYYFNHRKNKIETLNIDILSHEFKNDCLSVVRALRFLGNQQFFKEIEKPNWIVWSDCGI